jgi:hypothetical protein
MPPPAAQLCMELSDIDDSAPLTLRLDGLHDRAGPCRRVLVRQNPWSKFDPDGLAEVWEDGTRIFRNAAGERYIVDCGTNPQLGPGELHRRVAEAVLNDYAPKFTRKADALLPDDFPIMRRNMLIASLTRFEDPQTAALYEAAIGSIAGGPVGGFHPGERLNSLPRSQGPSTVRYTSGLRVQKAPEMEVYHYTPPNIADYPKIMKSMELWGRKTRFSDDPMVNAHRGPLPPGKCGFELGITVPPRPGQTSKGGFYTGVEWRIDTPGVRKVDDETLAIPVTILKVVMPTESPVPQ